MAPVIADADRIGQVVNNYLTNALKYSPSEQPCIWERFYRAKDTAVQCGSQAGLGLGLYICRTIIEYHGGQYGLQSAPSKGSLFWFTLPLAQNI